MAMTVTLRRWQRDALIAFADRPLPDFLAVACPGAGKTTFALAAVRAELGGVPRPVIITVPTAHLKQQWAEAASRFGLHLDPEWRPEDGLSKDMHGIVITYSQAASSRHHLRRLVGGGIVVLDEVHHAASDRSWGDGVFHAFQTAGVRLLLSGTPFRSDDNPIPFVRYSFGDHGEAVSDFDYGYGEALEEGGVVRPVYFPRFDGHMEWMDASGALKDATFRDEVDRADWSARLRTALDCDGNWLPTVLDKAVQRLDRIRTTHLDAGGLVIATDHEHAREIAAKMTSLTNAIPEVVLSDDPRASEKIARFASSTDPWIIAVRMISEGVDVPRLRVAVFATTTTTALFFRQAVGRIARWTPGLTVQPAYFFVPDDHRLRGHAATIAMQRRHSVQKRPTSEIAMKDPTALDDREEQMSLFAALSSTVLEEERAGSDGIDPSEAQITSNAGDLVGHPFDLPPPPPLAGRGEQHSVPDALADIRSRFVGKRELRDKNSDRVRTIARIVGWEHRAVNGELNRRSGVHRITEATTQQLEHRLQTAEAWLEQLTGS
ncbi:MAG: superfamily II DNA or RNA helicase [Verrucomicrobiales bacterium]|jgi:superfamily II DNA or RNA helicase